MQPILFRIPITAEGIPVYCFGMMLFLGFLAGLWVACRRARKEGIGADVVQDVALWLFIGGILGARTTFLILHREVSNLAEYFVKLPRIWEGGIILYGAFIGAFAVYWIGWYFFFRHKLNYTTARAADCIVLGLTLGLSIGRLGCLLNGCCYGAVACTGACPAVAFPLSSPARYELVRAGHQTAAGFLLDRAVPVVTAIEPGSAVQKKGGLRVGDRIVAINGVAVESTADVDNKLVAGWPRGDSELLLTVERAGEKDELKPVRPVTLGLLPTQVFETISMGLAFCLLLAYLPFRRRPGQVLGLFLICYGLHRFLNEILRSDTRPEGFESWISYIVIASGVFVWTWLAFVGEPEPTPQLAEATSSEKKTPK